jgi:hypothetical protein
MPDPALHLAARRRAQINLFGMAAAPIMNPGCYANQSLTCAANGGPAFTESDYSPSSSSGLGLPPTMGPRPDVHVLA